MKTRRVLSLFLTVAMLVGMFVFPSTSVAAATDATAANNALPKVVFWGDSLTYGAGSYKKAYPLVFQDLIESNFGFTITKDNTAAGTTNKLANRGCGGNSMEKVVARSGAIPLKVKGIDEYNDGVYTLTVPDDCIGNLGNQATWYRNVSNLSGRTDGIDNVDHTTNGYIPVTVRKNNQVRYGAVSMTNTLSFKPEPDPSYSDWSTWLPGATIETREADSFVSEHYIPVIYMGTNDGVKAAEISSADPTKTNFQYYVDSILTHYGIDKTTGKYVVIFPEFKEEVASSTELDNLGTSMASVYGNHFINLRTISKENTDTYRFFDGIHYTQDGYDAIAQLVYDKFDSLGYFNELKTARDGGTTGGGQETGGTTALDATYIYNVNTEGVCVTATQVQTSGTNKTINSETLTAMGAYKSHNVFLDRVGATGGSFITNAPSTHNGDGLDAYGSYLNANGTVNGSADVPYIMYKIDAGSGETVESISAGFTLIGGQNRTVSVYISKNDPTDSSGKANFSNCKLIGYHTCGNVWENAVNYTVDSATAASKLAELGDTQYVYVIFAIDNFHWANDVTGYHSKVNTQRNLDSVTIKATTSGGSTPTHQHSYSGYTYNETQHWQKCTGCEETTAKVNHTFVGGVCDCGAVDPDFEEPETLSISCRYDLHNIATTAQKPCTLASNILSSKGKAIVFAKTLPDSANTVQGDLAEFGLYAAHNVIFDGKKDGTKMDSSWGTLITPFVSQYWNSSDTSDNGAYISKSDTVTEISNVDFSYLTYRVKADSNKKITQLDTSVYARVPSPDGRQLGMYVMTPAEYASAIDANGKIDLYGKTAVWSFDKGNTSSGSFVYDQTTPKTSTLDTESLNSNELYVVVVMRRNASKPSTNSAYYSNYKTDNSTVRFFGIEIEATTVTTHTHDYATQNGQAATCTDAGFNGYKECQNDGCTVKYTDLSGNAIGDAVALATWKTTGAGKIAALGHQLDSGVEQTAATCTTGGVTRYSCTRANCDYYKDENTDPLGHQIDENAWEYDGENHWHVCTRLGCGAIIDTASHTLNGSPCGGSQCTVCGYQTEAGSHTLVYHAAVAADYDTTGKCIGNVEYWQCSACGAYFLDSEGAQPTTKSGVATGSHSWESGYTHNVANHWFKCSKCGATKDSTVPHTYGEYTNNGTTHSRTCTTCNYTETYTHRTNSCTGSATCTDCGHNVTAGHNYVGGLCTNCGATDYAYNPEDQGNSSIHDEVVVHKNPEISNIYNVGNATLPVGHFSGNKANNVFNANTIIKSCIDIKTGNLFIKNKSGTSGDSDGIVKTVEGSAVSKGYVSGMDKLAVYDAHHVFVDSASSNETLENYSDEPMVYLSTCDTRMWHNANNTYSMALANKTRRTDYDQYDYGVSLFDKSTWTTDKKVDFAYVTYKVKTTDGSKLKDLYFTPYGRIAVNNNIQVGFMLTKNPITDAAYVNNYETPSSDDKACVLNGFDFDDFVCILSNQYYTDNAPSSCNLAGKVSLLKTADGDDTRVALYQKYPNSSTHLPVADNSANLNYRTSFDFYGRTNNDRLDLDLSKAVVEMDTDTAYITVVLLTPGDSINIADGLARLSGYQTQTAIRITGFDINPPKAYQINIDKYDTYYMGANISLADEIKMNFYASFGTEDFERVQNGEWKVEMTAGNYGNKNYEMIEVKGTDVCDGVGLPYTGKDKHGSEAVNTYKFTIPVPAKMMTDTLTFKVIDTATGLAVIDEEYSVKQYGADVKKAYGKTSPTSEYTINGLEEIVNAMLDYGTAAQEYLDYHTGNLANDGNWVAGINSVVPSYTNNGTNSTGACDIKLVAGNINLEENIHLRLCLAYTNGTKNHREYYTVKLAYRAENKGDTWVEYSTDAAENSGRKLTEYHFPDEDATPTKYTDRSELYYFYIPLMAKQMDDIVRVQVWKDGVCILERYYSIYMYCYSMYTTSNLSIKNGTRIDHYTKLKKLCQATYSYGQQAQKYARYGLGL